jgi:hypothetical protein
MHSVFDTQLHRLMLTGRNTRPKKPRRLPQLVALFYFGLYQLSGESCPIAVPSSLNRKRPYGFVAITLTASSATDSR